MVEYFGWHENYLATSSDKCVQIVAASDAIHAHENLLADEMLYGVGNLKGLAQMANVEIIGGVIGRTRHWAAYAQR